MHTFPNTVLPYMHTHWHSHTHTHCCLMLHWDWKWVCSSHTFSHTVLPYMHTHWHSHTHSHTQSHTHTHAHTRTHTHTLKCNSKVFLFPFIWMTIGQMLPPRHKVPHKQVTFAQVGCLAWWTNHRNTGGAHGQATHTPKYLTAYKHHIQMRYSHCLGKTQSVGRKYFFDEDEIISVKEEETKTAASN